MTSCVVARDTRADNGGILIFRSRAADKRRYAVGSTRLRRSVRAYFPPIPPEIGGAFAIHGAFEPIELIGVAAINQTGVFTSK